MRSSSSCVTSAGVRRRATERCTLVSRKNRLTTHVDTRIHAQAHTLAPFREHQELGRTWIMKTIFYIHIYFTREVVHASCAAACRYRLLISLCRGLICTTQSRNVILRTYSNARLVLRQRLRSIVVHRRRENWQGLNRRRRRGHCRQCAKRFLNNLLLNTGETN